MTAFVSYQRSQLELDVWEVDLKRISQCVFPWSHTSFIHETA